MLKEIAYIILFILLSVVSVFATIGIGVSLRRIAELLWKGKIVEKIELGPSHDNKTENVNLRDYIEKNMRILYQFPRPFPKFLKYVPIVFPIGLLIILLLDHYEVIEEYVWAVYLFYTLIWIYFTYHYAMYDKEG